MSPIFATVAVTSRVAYISCQREPDYLFVLQYSSRTVVISDCDRDTLNPGIASSLSSVPPV